MKDAIEIEIEIEMDMSLRDLNDLDREEPSFSWESTPLIE
jgi:hypothetical protein